MHTKIKVTFTFMELLVAVVIIALLAAILCPILGRASEEVRHMRYLRNVMPTATEYLFDHGSPLPYKYQNVSNKNGSELDMLFSYRKNRRGL